MGLSHRLLNVATTRPPYLLVAVPGQPHLRFAAERALRRRGWPAASSAAGACVLVVAGAPGEGLSRPVAEVWRQMPLPRTRVDLARAGEVEVALDRGVAQLRDLAAQRDLREREERGRETGEGKGGDPPDAAPASESRDDMNHADMDHGEAGDGQEHEGSGHDTSETGMPGGLMMADVAPDRDGLSLDQLHVPLGPVLPHWPPGLVLHLTLQGEVVQAAHVEVLGPAHPDGPPVPTAAARLDSLAHLLGVLGSERASTAAVRLRDEVVAGSDDLSLRRQFEQFARRLEGSRLLRALTAGVGRHEGKDAEQRWRRWLVEVRAGLGPGSAVVEDPDPRDVLRVLPNLVTGLDIADVRLVVASFPLTTEVLTAHQVA